MRSWVWRQRVQCDGKSEVVRAVRSQAGNADEGEAERKARVRRTEMTMRLSVNEGAVWVNGRGSGWFGSSKRFCLEPWWP